MLIFSDHAETVYILYQLGKSRDWSGWTKGGAGKKANNIKYIIAVELKEYGSLVEFPGTYSFVALCPANHIRTEVTESINSEQKEFLQ